MRASSRNSEASLTHRGAGVYSGPSLIPPAKGTTKFFFIFIDLPAQNDLMNQATAQATASVGDALANARQLLLSHPGAAARQAQAIIKAEPGIAEAHLILAAAFRLVGRFDEAEAAEREGIRVSGSDPVLMRAAALIASRRDSDA